MFSVVLRFILSFVRNEATEKTEKEVDCYFDSLGKKDNEMKRDKTTAI